MLIRVKRKAVFVVNGGECRIISTGIENETRVNENR